MLNKIIENYKLIHEVGTGEFGKVYKSIKITTNQEFAIKQVSHRVFDNYPKLKEFTVNEIQTLSKINNIHVVKLIEMLKTANNIYFVYEFCNGGTLENHLNNRGYLSEKESLQIFTQLLNGLRSVICLNIIHRDLKPQNIMFHDNKVKICDFGFCKPLDNRQDMIKTMLGSPIYMAPEILKGQDYCMKADIWSLGVILYEMLYGFCPYDAKNIVDLISVIDNQDLKFDINKNVSSQTKTLIKRMLTKNSDLRVNWDTLFEQYLPPIQYHPMSNSQDLSKEILESNLFKNHSQQSKPYQYQQEKINQQTPQKSLYDQNKEFLDQFSQQKYFQNPLKTENNLQNEQKSLFDVTQKNHQANIVNNSNDKQNQQKNDQHSISNHQLVSDKYNQDQPAIKNHSFLNDKYKKLFNEQPSIKNHSFANDKNNYENNYHSNKLNQDQCINNSNIEKITQNNQHEIKQNQDQNSNNSNIEKNNNHQKIYAQNDIEKSEIQKNSDINLKEFYKIKFPLVYTLKKDFFNFLLQQRNKLYYLVQTFNGLIQKDCDANLIRYFNKYLYSLALIMKSEIINPLQKLKETKLNDNLNQNSFQLSYIDQIPIQCLNSIEIQQILSYFNKEIQCTMENYKLIKQELDHIKLQAEDEFDLKLLFQLTFDYIDSIQSNNFEQKHSNQLYMNYLIDALLLNDLFTKFFTLNESIFNQNYNDTIQKMNTQQLDKIIQQKIAFAKKCINI